MLKVVVMLFIQDFDGPAEGGSGPAGVYLITLCGQTDHCALLPRSDLCEVIASRFHLANV
jgi:hypothetical protein